MVFEYFQSRHACDKNGWLAKTSLGQFYRRAFKAHCADIKINELCCAVKDFLGHRVSLIKIFSHPGKLRSLPREKVSDSYHSSTIAPQTKPLPKVAKTTLSFFFIFPTCSASHNAMTQEALEVLPYF